MKIAILYHSESGNTRKAADLVAQGAARISGVQAVPMSIEAIDEGFVTEARAIIVGFPVYAGSCSWQIKRWVDTTKLKLGGKLGSVFATANHVGGGADLAELVILGALMVRGMITYTAGAALGQPYTHFGAVSIRDGDQAQRERTSLLGERVAAKALELWPAG